MSPTVRLIADVACEFYGVRYEQLISAQRTASLVRARHATFFLARRLSTRSLSEIGRLLGRDHSAVLHGARKIEASVQTDPELAEQLETLLTAVEAAEMSLAKVAVVQPADMSATAIALRVLAHERGPTTISLDELRVLASAAAAFGVESEAEPSSSSGEGDAPLQPDLQPELVAAVGDLLRAVRAADSADGFGNRGDILNARRDKRLAMERLEAVLVTIKERERRDVEVA